MENSDDIAKEKVSPEERAAFVYQRSEIYHFFSALFNHLPDITLAENLKNPESSDLRSFFDTVEGELSSNIDEGLQLLEKYMLSCQDKSAEDIKTELSVDRVCLMRGVKYTYGSKAPLETSYIEDSDLHKVLTSVRDNYREAGLIIQKEVKERPDYIGIELDFMGFLTQQEAQAWQEKNTEAAEAFSKKQHAFLNDHLYRWVPTYCQSMLEEAQTDFYRGIACLLSAFVLQESQQN